jgi:hypothetical protein
MTLENNDTASIFWSIHRVVRLLATGSEPFSDVEFVKKIQHIERERERERDLFGERNYS